jgi:diguanylate cyclase (GGDEF)-like protein
MATDQGALDGSSANRERAFGLIRTRQHITFPLIGALLAMGAPLGLVLLRRFAFGDHTPIAEDLRRDFATYMYLAISTTLAFTLLGWMLGRYADRLAELSRTDPLTGLANARAFYPGLDREIERSRRSGSPVSLLLLDLDDLKALNDRHGHATGDRVLREIARAVRRELRAADIGARLGGDEFGVLAVGASAASGRALAERLRRSISSEVAKTVGLPVTGSVGVVTFDPAGGGAIDSQALTHAVDRALYTAKKNGRNRVSTAEIAGRAAHAGGCRTR